MESLKESDRESKNVAGCISESLMNANDMQAVVVISITKDGYVMTSWAATFAERIAMAAHFRKAIDMEMEDSIDEADMDELDIEDDES